MKILIIALSDRNFCLLHLQQDVGIKSAGSPTGPTDAYLRKGLRGCASIIPEALQKEVRR
jgi:hypothetical protein